MASTEDIQQHQQRLEIHRRNLAHYLSQFALLGSAYVPPGIVNGIAEEQNNIRRVKDVLREWGVLVEDGGRV